MSEYIVNTFITKKEEYYKSAINFYRQKSNALIKSLQTEMIAQGNKKIKTIKSVESLFNDAMETITTKLQGNLEPLMDAKISGLDIQKRIAQWNKETDNISKGLENGFNTIEFINTISDGKVFKDDPKNLPEFINLSDKKTALLKLASNGYDTAAAAGGARALVMGELTEQILLSLIQEGFADVVDFIKQTGMIQTKGISGVYSGKSDIMIGAQRIDFIDNEETNTKYSKGQINGQTFELDLEEAVDLENSNINTLINKYTSGVRGQAAGITIKQWTDKLMGNRRATFAHSAYTVNLINDRWPEGISEGFSNRKDFRNYTAYIISRFIINIIGVYNAFVANSSGIEPTYLWLQMLLDKNYQLEHVVQLVNGLYRAKTDGGNTIYIAKTPH